ncbi:dihydrolipoyl dehydrogenase [Johnsonella ignava]|jgi:hypothetical protein|uniref:dihydrolipoyl dehydrogenase n=1 Tax=Johnsonella ignava TaxID=43995 RepID=UPI0023F1ABCC|nr:dihydrolipoyl dehydrogenase [Johnsonella ignava]
METNFDVIVIGAGPGGYVAALKAAKLGFKTAVMEERRVGGTCLNRGCIPAKAMIHASSLYREIKEAEAYGITASGVSYDYGKILAYKQDVIDKLCQGVEHLFKTNSISYINAKGTLEKDGSVTVADGEYKGSYKAKHIVLATGSKPSLIPVPGLDSEGVLTSDELFKLEEVPQSLVIIGGGVIGVEFASVFAALGTKVTILEALANVVANMDKDISQNLKLILKKRGIDIHTSVSVGKVERDGGSLVCTYTEKEKEVKIASQYVLCAVGRIPNTEGLFGEGVSLEMERGRVVVDEHFKTSMDNVYAIGDLIKGMQLAHLASAQGICLMEELAGHKRSIDLNIVPGCVYTDPEIGSVGITEADAKEKGIEVSIGKFMMSANGKSLISKEERGFVKVVADKNSKVILGAQMMCARATDMIGEFATAVANKLTVDQLLKGMRAHPTYNEAVGEALEDVFGESIHSAPKKK